MLAAAGDRDWIYTPAGAPQDAWRPTVTSVTANGNGSYHLTGTQLSGFVTTGDTLAKLACQYGTSVHLLQQVNHLGHSTRLLAGQKLRVPALALRPGNCGTVP